MPSGQLVRSKDDRMIVGVCGGLGRYLDWDSTAIRVLFVLSTIFSLGVPGVVAYIILGIVIPSEE